MFVTSLMFLLTSKQIKTFLPFLPLHIKLNKRKLSTNSVLHPSASQFNHLKIKSQSFWILMQLTNEWRADSMLSKQKNAAQLMLWITTLLHNSTWVKVYPVTISSKTNIFSTALMYPTKLNNPKNLKVHPWYVSIIKCTINSWEKKKNTFNIWKPIWHCVCN
jgi:hypothetical protein